MDISKINIVNAICGNKFTTNCFKLRIAMKKNFNRSGLGKLAIR